jgi:bacterioferritin (cytochrome b1)
MPERRSLSWRLNWYRQSEIDGALLLGRMVRHATDPYLVARLTKHCADEARHAWQWMRTLEMLGLPTVRIRRGYQSFYLDEMPAPRTTLELLALTHVFELSVQRHFIEERDRPDVPDAVRVTFSALLRDEQEHLDWIGDWLSAEANGADILTRYRRVDARVVHRLTPFRERLWDVEGLGEELIERDRTHRAKEERHPAESQHPT